MGKIEQFLEKWVTDPIGCKDIFVMFYKCLAGKQDVKLVFNTRHGVSHSLRAVHRNDSNRTLFVIVDVIDDDPLNRWLSVCFYEDMITDPDDMGELIPNGLLGEDGYCFDVTEPDGQLAIYIKQRIEEAYTMAGS